MYLLSLPWFVYYVFDLDQVGENKATPSVKEVKNLRNFLIKIALSLTVLSISLQADLPFANAQQYLQAPPYAKWGRLAMEQVAQRYKVDILDYDHIGRQIISSEVTQETFKLWVRDQTNQEYGIFVYIQFDTETEKVHSIRFKETER